MLSKIRNYLTKPTPIGVLCYFRIVFGLITTWEVLRYFSKGWIHKMFIQPEFYFYYELFPWVQPWDGNAMYLHFLVLGALAVFITLGLFYRLCMPLFFLAFTYIFLIDKTHYLNHFYLISLVSGVMIFLPLNRNFSIDSLIWPKIRQNFAPYWVLFLIQFQLGVAYFFGGIAKINTDWLQGEPMRMWLAKRVDFPIIGQFFTQEWMVYTFTYGGLFFDLLVIPFLVWRKTRVAAFIAAASFHLMNMHLFRIGIFPWFMLFATAIFFSAKHFNFFTFKTEKLTVVKPKFKLSNIALSLISFYIIIQLLLPFRHWLYQGNVNWTEQGHRFAWHMKLRSKKAKGKIWVIDKATGGKQDIDLDVWLTDKQERKMFGRPDMLLQFAHFLKDRAKEKTGMDITVHAKARSSLNGRAYQQIISEEIDLASIPLFTPNNKFVIPLNTPLKE